VDVFYLFVFRHTSLIIKSVLFPCKKSAIIKLPLLQYFASPETIAWSAFQPIPQFGVKMIVTSLENLPDQMAMTPAMQKAVDYLKNVHPAELQPGQVELDGKNVYVMIQTYETRPITPEVRLEAHRDYIDIQYVASGEEWMGWAHIHSIQNPTAYNPEKDVFYGTLPANGMSLVQVLAGQAAIFYPEDAHAPKLASSKPAGVVKIVIKVHI
jgi:biofilm protein TabA